MVRQCWLSMVRQRCLGMGPGWSGVGCYGGGVRGARGCIQWSRAGQRLGRGEAPPARRCRWGPARWAGRRFGGWSSPGDLGGGFFGADVVDEVFSVGGGGDEGGDCGVVEGAG